jgi:diaminopimelate epimerase
MIMAIKNAKVEFAKLVAAGNDFILMDNRVLRITSAARLKDLAARMCDRKYGIGADGLLVLESSAAGGFKMRIFNPDGTEAGMCGNGARCFAYYLSGGKKDFSLSFETKSGTVKARVNGFFVRINITGPKGLRLGIPLKLSGRSIRVNFIDTGVPHAVIFVEGLQRIDVSGLGRRIRYHSRFAPEGANVDFVEVIKPDAIKIRTYERGVEGETLACGTGSIAAALVTAASEPEKVDTVKVSTAGGEILKVHFARTGHGFKDVWLEGEARLVYRGEYYV